MPRSTLPALLTIPLLVGLAACANPPGTITPGLPPGLGSGTAAGAITALPASLIERFDGCADLLTYYQANALEQVGPYGLGGGYYGYGGDDMAMAADGAESAAGGGDASAPAHSSTNVQEVGVDEADLVKTNGAIIVTATSGKVRIVDVATQQVISSVRMPGRGQEVQPSELLLHGDTLVVLSQEWGGWVQPTDDRQAAFPPSRTIITTVDLTDPANPQTVGSVRLEGNYVSARMIDESIRLVMVTEPPGVEQTWPTKSTMAAEEQAEATNRELIRASTIEDWVPHLQELDASGATVSTEPLLDCHDVSRPRDPAGLSTMSILTFDVGSSTPRPTSGTGLVASGSTVYASTDRLIVGTNRWDSARWGGPAGDGMEWGGDGESNTDLHSFDISDPNGTTYRGSGTVEGYLLSQWAIDEEDGVIRVATTTDPREASAASQSSLIMLREDGDQLVETGRVDGLGLTEQVRSVRYLTPDLAAVVTFRQTDPLYLIDTSDPASPRVAGELKIPGYSAYLHPIGEDHLLGIGQDADPETGQTKGLQVSLFDISDTSAPRQVEVMTWEDTYTSIEWDHRAFTSWPATGQVFVPISHYSQDGNESFAGVLALSVGDGSLSQDARVSTAPKENSWGEGPLRTMVIGEDLWTLDYQGLGRFDLDTMSGGWAIDLP